MRCRSDQKISNRLDTGGILTIDSKADIVDDGGYNDEPHALNGCEESHSER